MSVVKRIEPFLVKLEAKLIGKIQSILMFLGRWHGAQIRRTTTAAIRTARRSPGVSFRPTKWSTATSPSARIWVGRGTHSKKKEYAHSPRISQINGKRMKETKLNESNPLLLQNSNCSLGNKLFLSLMVFLKL